MKPSKFPTLTRLLTEQDSSTVDQQLARRLLELQGIAGVQKTKNIAQRKRVQEMMVDFVKNEKLDIAAKTGAGSDIQVEQNVIVDFLKGADDAFGDVIEHYENIAMAADLLHRATIENADPEPEVVESILYDFSNTLSSLGFTDVFKAIQARYPSL